MTSVFDRIGNLVGKGQNAGFHKIFKKCLFLGHYNLGLIPEGTIKHFGKRGKCGYVFPAFLFYSVHNV